jgi:Cof subfamily protein (haloacid dehalogenase superfamily)
MQRKYKLLVADIEGTLTNELGNISVPDMEAVRLLKESGIQLALCSGWAVKSCTAVMQKLHAPGFHIFFDGALVCNADQSKTVFSRSIDKKRLSEIRNLAHLDGVTLELFTHNGYYIERATPLASLHSHLLNMDWTVTEFAPLCEKEPIIMGCLVLPATEEAAYRGVLTSFGERKGLRFSWTTHPAWPLVRFVNITADDVSEGRALKALCAHLGVNLDDVAAIGDGANDVSLLEVAGLAIAMQSAPAELKAVADQITADVKYNGFSQAVMEFLLDF